MRGADKSGEAFLEAQTYYLRGDWFETECCLKKIIKKNRCDVEARLLAATLFRHLKRFSEAKKMLAELEKMEASAYWQDEIKQERIAIAVEEETDKKSAESQVSSNEDSVGASGEKV